MLRLVAGIILGYALFVFAALLVFQFPGRDPHAPADSAFMVGTIGGGIIAAVTGGYVGAAVARGREHTAGLAIALIIAGAALATLVSQPAADPRWSQLAALFVMSPSAFLGAFIRARRVRVR